MALRSISLFAGGGGLDLGVHAACGAESVCYVEREAYAAAVLVARMQEGGLAQATVWSDVATFDGRAWHNRVDLIVGGFPCQDISNAGKRAGIDGERSGLWREYARIIEETNAPEAFIENVSALRTRGLDRVLSDLAALGFDAEWTCVRASAVGAPHRRERIFILARRVAHAVRERRGLESRGLGGPRGQGAPDAAHARQNLAAWPPGPEERDRWLRMPEDAQPAICRNAHGLADQLVYRADRLRLLGNGVVPAQAEYAYRTLDARWYEP